MLNGVCNGWTTIRSQRARRVPEHIFVGHVRAHLAENFQPRLPFTVTRGAMQEPIGSMLQPYFGSASHYAIFPDRVMVRVVAPKECPKGKAMSADGPFRIAVRVSASSYALEKMTGTCRAQESRKPGAFQMYPGYQQCSSIVTSSIVTSKWKLYQYALWSVGFQGTR